MPSYKQMYHVLFREITRAISILQAAQQRTKALYIEDIPKHLTIIVSDVQAGEEKEKQPPQ